MLESGQQMIVDPSDTIGSPALELDLRFQHLGIAVNDVDEALPFYRDAFGHLTTLSSRCGSVFFAAVPQLSRKSSWSLPSRPILP